MSSTPCKATTCPYCGVGCGVDAEVSGTQVLEVKGTQSHPANLGRLCVKGSALHETVTQKNRLLQPEVDGQPAGWDEAMSEAADQFLRILKKHGPKSVAFYLSGQLLTEDYYVANKLMKGFIGSANVDTNSRLCMSSAVVGYKRAFGEDAVPLCYEDLEQSDLLIFTGSNAAWTHPVLYQRIAAAKKLRPEMKVVVIDPRQTATCDLADQHLDIKPGSDAFLFNGLLHYLQREGFLDNDFLTAHCEGLEDALRAVVKCTPESVADATGLDMETLLVFYNTFAGTERAITFYSQGINQSATGSDKCNAIINCHLATGKIGKPGAGPFSITGQPNAMGGREVGGLANQLAAHMDFDAEDVDRVGRFWNAPAMTKKPGLKAVDMFDAIAKGKIKAVWIMATNPVVSLPKSDKVRAALERCELVIVSDCIRNTDTSQYADILLPATGWSEKDGTVTNSERCISRQRALVPPSGEARPDWQIISDFASRLGFADAFNYKKPRDIFVEHAALSGFENEGQRLFNISALQNLDEEAYEELQPIQWPVTKERPEGTRRLFTDFRFSTPSGRARLVSVKAVLPDAATNVRFPYLLNTGRLRDQWHTMTRTGLVPRLLKHADAPFVAINPSLAQVLDVDSGELLEVSSTKGKICLPLKLDDGMHLKEVFVPIHWNDQFSSNAKVGKLMLGRTDPFSGQPEGKVEAVALQPVKVERWMRIVSRESFPTDCFAYWHGAPLAGGYSITAALPIESFNLGTSLKQFYPGSGLVEFHTELDGLERFMVTSGEGRLLAMAFTAPRQEQLPEGAWFEEALALADRDVDWQLLAGRTLGGEDKGKLVCTCFEVGEKQIRGAIGEGCSTVEALGAGLRCGTNCGSCLPELKKLLQEEAAVARSTQNSGEWQEVL